MLVGHYINVTDGQPMPTLQCPGSGGKVDWKYQTSAGSESVILNGRSRGGRLVLDTVNYTLSINNITVDDSGLYHCSEYDRIKHTFNVTVEPRSKSACLN